LRFAEPIFGSAYSIIAVCIASISSFWTNPDFRSVSGRYLKHQRESAKSIYRLFVFETAGEVMRFRSILQSHHDTYGKIADRNGVFLCSTNAYLKLCSRWSRSPDQVHLNRDFGILAFEELQSRMYATLDNAEFRYKLYGESDPDYSSNRLVVELFDVFSELPFGSVDSESGVMRWSPEWAKSDADLAQALETLFQDKSKAITHYVLIKASTDSDSLASSIYDLCARLYRDRQLLRIRAVNVTRRCDIAVSDARFGSPLRVWGEFDYLLTMQLEDEDALRHYYQHEVHSVERERLYAQLNPEVAALFAAANALPRTKVEKRAQLFSAIEKRMTEKGFIRRFDVRNDEPLVSVIARLAASSSS
jgi:hypothetical protein